MTPLEPAALSDAHAHLESYTPEQLEGQIARAKASGVGIVIANGITLRSSMKSVEIAGRYDFMWATVGLHPYHCQRLAGEVGKLRELAASGKVVAIGEIGLDFVRAADPPECQKPLFEQQLKVAVELGLPVVVHTRGAKQETRDAIVRSGISPDKVIIQGFTGGIESLKYWLDLGYYISIGSGVLDPGFEKLVAAVPRIPAEKLLLETDAAARRTLSQGLELATLKPIAEKVAELRGVPVDEIARITTANLKAVYGLNGAH